MKAKRSLLVLLFTELGVTTAEQWSDARMLKKIETLPSMVDDDTETESKETGALLKKLLKAVEAEEEIEIEDDTAAKPAKGKGKAATKEEAPAKAKGKGKKAAAAEEEEEDEDEPADEDEDEEEESEDEEDEEEEEKPAKAKGKKKGAPEKGKAPPKKAGGESGPGVIGSIVEFLSKATEKKPLSKSDLADKLAERFDDRDRDSMLKTINVQVPSRLKTDKKLDVRKNDKGYWIETEEAAEKPAKKKNKK